MRTASKTVNTTTSKAAAVLAPAAAAPSLPTPEEVESFIPLLVEKRELDARLRVMTAEGSPFDQLNSKFRAWTDTQPAGAPLILKGITKDLSATARENEASPDWKALVKFFGIKTLLSLCEITQKAVKQGLAAMGKPEAGFEAFFTKQRTGSRKWGIVAKTGPVGEAA